MTWSPQKTGLALLAEKKEGIKKAIIFFFFGLVMLGIAPDAVISRKRGAVLLKMIKRGEIF